MKATFRVQNVEALQPGLPLEAVFSQRGGFIGSGMDTTWQVQDVDGAIPETAARIVAQGQQFTIEALNGTDLRINDARSTIPPRRAVILSDKDRIRIGALDLVLSLPSSFASEIGGEAGSVSKIIGGKDVEDALVISGEVGSTGAVEEDSPGAGAVDPMDALAKGAASRPSDPMAAFDAAARARAPENTDDVFEEIHKPALPEKDDPMGDQSDWHFSAMPAQPVQRDRFGFEEEGGAIAGTPPAPDAATLELGGPVDHVALRPLARALGIQLGDLSTDEANRVLADIGGALRNALEGLNRIYRSRDGGHGHFQLSKMHLHALEDNPIQFSNGVDEALHAFFSKRGPVHLSAPSAFQETLEHMLAHQASSEHAIDEALDTVMTALSPAALQKRFRSYESEPAAANRDEMDAWCWRMYRAYFNELLSERQRGLQMLFWEVFAQEYQLDMRRRERSRYLEAEEAV